MKVIIIINEVLGLPIEQVVNRKKNISFKKLGIFLFALKNFDLNF